MKGKIFKMIYEDDDNRVRNKWIIYEKEGKWLLWFKNPLHNLRLENIKLEQIMRMEERNLPDLLKFLKENEAFSKEIKNKIFKATGIREIPMIGDKNYVVK